MTALRHQIQILICETLLWWAAKWAPMTDEGNVIVSVVRQYFSYMEKVRVANAAIKKNGCP